ncbi:unnamed protein product, partial [Ceratitis capitata]
IQPSTTQLCDQLHQHITTTSVEYSKEFRHTTTKHCAANCTIELATFRNKFIQPSTNWQVRGYFQGTLTVSSELKVFNHKTNQ